MKNVKKYGHQVHEWSYDLLLREYDAVIEIRL